MAGVAAGAIVMSASAAWAQSKPITVEPQPLMSALHDFGSQTGVQILYAPEILNEKVSSGVVGAENEQTALSTILAGTGLTFRREASAYVIVREGAGGSSPQSGSVAGDGAEVNAVEELIVTAQKREEAIQDVPIAISAFTQKALEEQKIEGGFDLLKAIPNVTFSKSNFSGYNFSIRGIGTKAVSVTTDAGVAVAFNGTTLKRNRLFEQEYLDVERVEVLRGPQGTLYGRNATGGVINVISEKAKLGEFDGWIKGEVGNYDTKRVSAMVNVPLFEEVLAVRLAGALTDRQGYDFNATTGNAINGRELWTARLSIGFEPTEWLRTDFIWERFEEDDNRSRTGKQLCHRDPGRTQVGSYGPVETPSALGFLSQGCKPGSLYDSAAFGTPNGLAIPFIVASGAGFALVGGNFITPVDLLQRGVDPYGGAMQSTNLRVINSIRDPIYRAKTDVFELNGELDLTSELTFISQTAYVEDAIYSFQDFNRFTTEPIFTDTRLAANPINDLAALAPGGVFCDPQIGCSDKLAGFDISQAKSTQFSQEFRLQSAFDGPLNFSIGANYLRYQTVEDYYVMYNVLTAMMMSYENAGGQVFNASADPTMCAAKVLFLRPPNRPPESDLVAPGTMVKIGEPGSEGCIYIDTNPVESIDGEGHNYFRSKNPYKLHSWAGFGEVYWEVAPDLKLTGGLRYTHDRKTFTPVPSQVALTTSNFGGGSVDRGYPASPDIVQTWGEVTGRLVVDWKPELSFTDDTMVYASYSRGYKGGGANPPGIGFREGAAPSEPTWILPASFPKTFEPEFVHAFEIGAKNALLDGSLILNVGAFYYDYKDYQVSQIKERTAVNENFDSTVWGIETEATWWPTRDLRFNMTFGYQDTEIATGEQSIDLMDRLQGHEDDYVLVKPWLQLASNCVVPIDIIESLLLSNAASTISTIHEHSNLVLQCPGTKLSLNRPETTQYWPSGGQGFYADLSGNELPNAPHWTVSLGSQYGFDFADSWRATVRADGYWQSQSWARVYNAVNDKLHGWYNANLSLWIENDDGLKIELYAKNILDDTPITDAFLNSDDTALTTNVFVLDPRLIGLSVRKAF